VRQQLWARKAVISVNRAFEAFLFLSIIFPKFRWIRIQQLGQRRQPNLLSLRLPPRNCRGPLILTPLPTANNPFRRVRHSFEVIVRNLLTSHAASIVRIAMRPPRINSRFPTDLIRSTMRSRSNDDDG
jgi:hypothetical protein